MTQLQAERQRLWCNECQQWRGLLPDNPESPDPTYTCTECGEGILCDECGQEWSSAHQCETREEQRDNTMTTTHKMACCSDMFQLCGHNLGREDAIIAELARDNAAMLEALREIARVCLDLPSIPAKLHAVGIVQARAIIDRIEGQL